MNADVAFHLLNVQISIFLLTHLSRYINKAMLCQRCAAVLSVPPPPSGNKKIIGASNVCSVLMELSLVMSSHLFVIPQHRFAHNKMQVVSSSCYTHIRTNIQLFKLE